MKILSIDDSTVVRRIIKVTVASLGYETLGAADATEALEILSADYSRINLILLDWNMPGMSGYELLKELKKTQNYKDIPVMMVTTESEKSNIVDAVRAGAVNYLTKPFSNEDLIMKIMECMENVK